MEEQETNNNAKFAFFYLLSLVALIFMTLSTGIIIFQVINKNIIDILDSYQGRYSSDALKFAISAIIISAPIYYAMVRQINKNLFSGLLNKEAGVRRWLSYLILLISSVVMIGWLIVTIYSFLEGELTIKFILKSLTAIAIAATVFTYYRYDVKRDNVVGSKDKVIKFYFIGSLIIVIVALVSAFVFVESPMETRNKRYDSQITGKFNQIDNAVNTYSSNKKKLPGSLDELLEEARYLKESDIKDNVSKKRFGYNIINENTYELCADFKTSNTEDDQERYYIDKRWEHDSGYQCLKKNIGIKDDLFRGQESY